VKLAEAVLRLREEYPRWGKDKLVILLHREGFTSSASTAGRILKKLKERGVLKEPLPNHISARKSQRQRPYAIKKPKDYVVNEPGDIVEADTPLRRMPFPVKVIQVDGGSEFQDCFEEECQRRVTKLFVLRHAHPNSTDM
jgi:putative transposase